MTIALPESNTRTETNAYMSTKFIKGDSVGVFVYQRAEDGTDGEIWLSNVKYTYDGSRWIPEAGGEIVIDENDALNYYAYYPYNEQVKDYKRVPFQPYAEQNVAMNYNCSDFLRTKNNKMAKGANSVQLHFEHAFTLIQLNLNGTEAIDPNTAVTLCGMKTQVMVDLTSDEVTTVEGEAVDINMYQFSNKKYNMVYRAVVPAQTIEANAKMIEIRTGDQVKLFNNAGEALNLNLMSVCPLHVLLGESTEHDVNIGINIGSWKVDPEIELE